MRWYVLTKPTGYKTLYAARPPVGEGPVIADYETYAEAAAAMQALKDFDASLPPKGNA